jgi:DNA-binding transcriptional LysR family regulator
VLVCAPEHPLSNRRSVAIEELHGGRMVSFDGDLQIRREIDRVLNSHHVETIVEMEFDNIETIKRAVEINAGVSLLPLPTVKREVQAGTLKAVPLKSDELVRPLGILVRRGKELSSTARRFIDLLRSEAMVVAGAGGEETAHASNGASHASHGRSEDGGFDAAASSGGGTAAAESRIATPKNSQA